jgi:hypothetical protein
MKVNELAAILVAVGLVHEDAVCDAEGYDGGRTFDNICALFDKLFPPSAVNAARADSFGAGDGCLVPGDLLEKLVEIACDALGTGITPLPPHEVTAAVRRAGEILDNKEITE